MHSFEVGMFKTYEPNILNLILHGQNLAPKLPTKQLGLFILVFRHGEPLRLYGSPNVACETVCQRFSLIRSCHTGQCFT